jgi:hypothetical protein
VAADASEHGCRCSSSKLPEEDDDAHLGSGRIALTPCFCCGFLRGRTRLCWGGLVEDECLLRRLVMVCRVFALDDEQVRDTHGKTCCLSRRTRRKRQAVQYDRPRACRRLPLSASHTGWNQAQPTGLTLDSRPPLNHVCRLGSEISSLAVVEMSTAVRV